jgi:hypothetical protein
VLSKDLRKIQYSVGDQTTVEDENSDIESSRYEIVSSAGTLEMEELNSKLKIKTVELAKKAKENNELQHILIELKEKVNECVAHPAAIPRIGKDMISLLDSVLISNDSTFEIHLDELHQEFSQKLKLKYPELTVHDVRLATYIRIGLNSKEISGLLNIKPSSVYISRSRLRKKIDLDTDIDLHGYLNKI